FQAVQSGATANGRSRLLFQAELPALGYRSYRVVQRGDSAAARAPEGAPSEPAPGEAQRESLENERLRLEFDAATGFLVSLFDKDAGVEALAGPAARPVVIADPSDTWGHNVFRFDEVAGEFAATSL